MSNSRSTVSSIIPTTEHNNNNQNPEEREFTGVGKNRTMKGESDREEKEKVELGNRH